MPRIGISYKQVEQVANELAGDGRKPTTRLVRDRLGTGSPNTIQKHLIAWHNARPQAMASELQAPAATSQPVALQAEPTNRQKEDSMAQDIFNLLLSFNLSTVEKLNVMEAVREKMIEHETDRRVGMRLRTRFICVRQRKVL